jgi:UDP-N-acetylglucosamine 2-epimerase
MLMPEGIGLVATDALAAGRPFVTMRGQAHGPEFAYLRNGATALVGASVDEMTRNAMRIMNDPDLRLRMGNKCAVDGGKYSIEGMSARFVEGVLEAVS